MGKTLNQVDPRLMNHGKRVAYLTYRALKRRRAIDENRIKRSCILALLHDIGAYKTEEIDKMVQFETQKVWEHSVYGYLFIKYFSPLKDLAPVILFHHADCRELSHLHPSYRELAQIIHIADRFDILSQTENRDTASFRQYFDRQRGISFDPSAMSLFFRQGWEHTFDDMENDESFEEILYGGEFSQNETAAYIQIIVLSIDFCSPQTVTHTLTSACICNVLSQFIHVDREELNSIQTGVMLHDLGKVGIPLGILEKTGKLDEAEMSTMKKHIEITEDILSGEVPACILNLAVRHYEKLDGSGYPRGLHAGELSNGQRIIAVADIVSALCSARSYKEPYPKEKVSSILLNMSSEGLIDTQIVWETIHHYERLMEEVGKTTGPILDIHKRMQREYADLLERAKGFQEEMGTGEIT